MLVFEIKFYGYAFVLGYFETLLQGGDQIPDRDDEARLHWRV